jgi:hypothetical protein
MIQSAGLTVSFFWKAMLETQAWNRLLIYTYESFSFLRQSTDQDSNAPPLGVSYQERLNTDGTGAQNK